MPPEDREALHLPNGNESTYLAVRRWPVDCVVSLDRGYRWCGANWGTRIVDGGAPGDAGALWGSGTHGDRAVACNETLRECGVALKCECLPALDAGPPPASLPFTVEPGWSVSAPRPLYPRHAGDKAKFASKEGFELSMSSGRVWLVHEPGFDRHYFQHWSVGFNWIRSADGCQADGTVCDEYQTQSDPEGNVEHESYGQVERRAMCGQTIELYGTKIRCDCLPSPDGGAADGGR